MCVCCTPLAFRQFPTFPHQIKETRQSSRFPGCAQRRKQRVTWRACLNALGRAIQSGRVRDVGRVVPLEADHRLSTPLLDEWKSDDAHWKDAVDAAIALLQTKLHKTLVAVYLRGSVAAGHAFSDGRSDLDLIALVHFLREKLYTSLMTKDAIRIWSREISSSVCRQFPFVSSVDVSIMSLDTNGATALPENVRFLLLAYCVPVFGIDVRASLSRPAPPVDTLCDIRAKEIQALRATAIDPKKGEFISWFLKFTLRGLVDLASPQTKVHARDIVPCTRILTKAYPEQEALITEAALIACDPGHKECTRSVQSVMRDLADFAEREFIRTMFGASMTQSPRAPDNFLVPPSDRLPALQYVREKVVGVVLKISRTVLVSPRLKSISFIRDELPQLALKSTKRARVITISKHYRGIHVGKRYLRSFRSPVVFRGVLGAETLFFNDSRTLAEELVCSQAIVSVRISSGNVFTFCRSTHPWISEDRFTPPSVLVRMPASEFFERISGEACARPQPLRYADERAYLQSEVQSEAKLFQLPNKFSIAQPERRWVSTHGSVSSAHYDCAHSALIQLSGEKRFIFFPPHVLPKMGLYPHGHPLHRRVCVDLSRPDAAMFRDFWANGALEAVEARLGPGDLVVFPPFWIHYTESIAAEGELSVSHTIRFLVE